VLLMLGNATTHGGLSVAGGRQCTVVMPKLIPGTVEHGWTHMDASAPCPSRFAGSRGAVGRSLDPPHAARTPEGGGCQAAKPEPTTAQDRQRPAAGALPRTGRRG
jgi:hypothetical protein